MVGVGVRGALARPLTVVHNGVVAGPHGDGDVEDVGPDLGEWCGLVRLNGSDFLVDLLVGRLLNGLELGFGGEPLGNQAGGELGDAVTLLLDLLR